MSEDLLEMAITEATAGAVSILDIGAGRGRWRKRYDPVAYVFSVDWYAPDLMATAPRPWEARCVALAEHLLYFFRPRAFTVALGLDIIEHFERDLALYVISKLQHVAERVCLFVPEGEHPQAGTPENPLQAHRSTWHRADFEALGFVVTSWPDFHHEPGKSSGALWCEWNHEGGGL